MKSKSKRLMIAVTLSVVLAGCTGSDDGDLSFSIYATPSRTHAPIDVSFEFLRDDGGMRQNARGLGRLAMGFRCRGNTKRAMCIGKLGNMRLESSWTVADRTGNRRRRLRSSTRSIYR